MSTSICVSISAYQPSEKCYCNKPWITGNIKQLLALRRKALQHNDQNSLHKHRAQLQREIRRAKYNMAAKTDAKFKQDPKSAWSGLKDLLKLKSVQIPCSVDVN
jgi:hypothetical protein